MQVVHFRLDQGVPNTDLANHDLVQRALLVAFGREIQAGGGICLRIGVNDEHLPLQYGKRSGKVDGCRRLTDAAFLVRNGDDF